MSSKKQSVMKKIFEDMEKTKKGEKTRILARRKAQKKGKTIVANKSTKKMKKPTRPSRKITKKRSSVK